MKTFYTLSAAAVLIFMVSKANAQSGFDQLIKSSPGDATKLVQNYAEPLFKGFGTGLNSGWNNTAKTKGFLHFDLRVTANIALVPSSDKSFDINKIGLSNHLQVDPSSSTSITPTISGNQSTATPLIDIKDDNGNKIGSFNMPKGQISVIPAPDIQLTVGLLKNTDLTIRTIPKINISSNVGSVGMIGFGIKHNIIQDFTGAASKLIPFDLALAVNYNRINYSRTLSVQPDAGAQPAPGTQAADFTTQRISAHFSGVNVQAIVSKKILFFTPFFSVAYQTSNTNFGVLGNFPITSTAPGQSGFYTTITDPVHISENSISGLRADLGFQLNLGFFRFYASYSAGQYQSVNGGIGFGI